MITYVDTSTLIKLVVTEPGSEVAQQIWITADALVSINLIEVEAHAALAAAQRAHRLTVAEFRRAIKGLHQLLEQIDTANITSELITTACRLGEVHGLRGYDAVHLAAARLIRADILASADVELCNAATREGFNVANPLNQLA